MDEEQILYKMPKNLTVKKKSESGIFIKVFLVIITIIFLFLFIFYQREKSSVKEGLNNLHNFDSSLYIVEEINISNNLDLKGSVNPAFRIRNKTTGEILYYFDHDGKILATNITIKNVTGDYSFFNYLGGVSNKVINIFSNSANINDINSSGVNSTEVYVNGTKVSTFLINQTQPAIDYTNSQGYLKNNTNINVTSIEVQQSSIFRGIVDFLSNVFINGHLNVTGNTTLQGDLNVSGAIFGRDFVCADKILCRYNVNEDCSEAEDGTLITNISAIWHLTQGTGTTATDDSGNSQTLTFGAGANAPTWVTTGKYETGLSFDGGDSLSRADDPILDMDNGHFSIGFWVYPTNVTTALYFLDKSRLDAVYNGYWIIFNNPTRTVALGLNDQVDSYTFTTTTALLTINTWNRVWITWNDTSENITISVNGIINSGVNSPIDIGSVANSASFYLGSYDGTQLFYSGRVNDFFIIKSLLSPIEADYLTSNRWYDKTYFDGKFSQGYYALNGNSLSYSTTNNIFKYQGTIEMWVKPIWSGNDNKNHVFFDLETESDTNQLQLIKTSGNILQFELEDSVSASCSSSFGVNSTNFQNNTLYHIAITWNSNLTSIYLDGIENSSISGSCSSLLALPSTMYVGRDATSQVNEAQSIFDEFKIYDRALTAQEIKLNYLKTTPSFSCEK